MRNTDTIAPTAATDAERIKGVIHMVDGAITHLEAAIAADGLVPTGHTVRAAGRSISGVLGELEGSPTNHHAVQRRAGRDINGCLRDLRAARGRLAVALWGTRKGGTCKAQKEGAMDLLSGIGADLAALQPIPLKLLQGIR